MSNSVMRLKFCLECEQELKKHGTVALDHYHSICGWYAYKGGEIFAEAGPEGKGPTMVAYLEQHGWLCTTETESGYLSIRPARRPAREAELKPGAVWHTRFCRDPDNHRWESHVMIVDATGVDDEE